MPNANMPKAITIGDVETNLRRVHTLAECLYYMGSWIEKTGDAEQGAVIAEVGVMLMQLQTSIREELDMDTADRASPF